ncbi:MAG: hypothetical protein AB7O74_14995 [Candidatus Nanopelagicales bacterium]
MGDAADLPDLAYVGAKIVHSTFGPGKVTFVGPYKGVPACSVQFEGHVKALELQYAIPHVRLAEDEVPIQPKKRGWFGR